MYTVIWYHMYPKVRSSLFLSFSQWMPFSPTRPRDRNHHPLTSETCQHPTSDALPLSSVCISCTYSRSVCDNLSSYTHSCEAFASLISFRQSPTYNYLASPALRQPFLLLFLHISSQIAVWCSHCWPSSKEPNVTNSDPFCHLTHRPTPVCEAQALATL